MGGQGVQPPPSTSVKKGATPGWTGGSDIYSFQEGGIVPGYPGQPQQAIVHGGETIIPQEQNPAGGLAGLLAGTQQQQTTPDPRQLMMLAGMQQLLAGR